MGQGHSADTEGGANGERDERPVHDNMNLHL
jgi:hypothetical protein